MKANAPEKLYISSIKKRDTEREIKKAMKNYSQLFKYLIT